MYETDFWWVDEELHRSLYLGVGHHKALTDDDNPCTIQWFHSLQDGDLSVVEKCYPLSFLHKWRKACNDINVYRTLTLCDKAGKRILLGPFLIDIDNSVIVNGYQEDLADALKVAQTTIKFLKTQLGIQENDLQVFFTGRKGFNIEVLPSSLGIRTDDAVDDQIRLSATKLDEIIDALRRSAGISSNAYAQFPGFRLYGTSNAVSDKRTSIDRIYGSRFNKFKLKHPYVRLHNSINEWIAKTGDKMARRKIRISLSDLFGRSAEQICLKAQHDVSTAFEGD